MGYGGDEGCRHDNRSRSRPDACRVPSGIRFVDRLKRQVREVENSLSVLLAKAPQPIDRSTLEDQVMPEELMAGVPLQLLENRPDVKVAEMTLAALIIRLIRPVPLFIRESILRRQRLDEWFGCYGFNPGQFMFQALASLAQLSLTMVSWWPT